MRALFPQDRSRRAFLRAVGASTAIAAISQFFPLGTAGEVFAQTAAPEKKDLKVGFIPITCATPIIMAHPMGFYTKHGLNVEVVKTAGWAVILDIKREKGWSWKHITEHVGGMSPVLVVGALLGQMKLVKPLAAKAAELFGLSPAEQRMLNEVPYRGTPMRPTYPLIYRFYELVMVNGPAWKALIEEEFGDGIMSAIDFDIDRAAAQPEGRPREDHHVRQVPALQVLWQRAGHPGVRNQGELRPDRSSAQTRGPVTLFGRVGLPAPRARTPR